MSKKESNILKGLAIVLMLCHHLFMYADGDSYSAYYGFILNTPERLAAFGNLCKLCVTLFVFVTAYGTAKSFKGDTMDDNRALMGISLRRWVKLLVSFQFVYVIAFVLCPLGGKSWFTLYSPSRLENIFFALSDFFGLSYILSTPSYNSAWWYMSFAVTLMLVLPWLIKLCRRFGWYIVLPGLLFVRWFNAEFVMYRYLLIVLLGILMAQNATIEHIKSRYFGAGLVKKLGILLLCLVCLGAVSVLWLRVNEILLDIYEAAMCISFSLLVLLTVARIPGVNTAVEFVGRHSMNMFFVHAFIYQNWFSSLTYSFKYPVLIFLFLFVTSLLFSIVVEWLKKLLHVSALADKLSSKLCGVMGI
jgi:hypothetical protein